MGNPIGGRETTIAAKKAAVWGTPVQCGAGDELLVLSSGLGREYALLEDRSLGEDFELDPQRGAQTAGGDLSGHLRYDNAEWMLLAILMGQAGVPAQQGVTAAYLHTLQLTGGIAGLFATIVQRMKSDELWEFPSVKPMSLRLTGGKRIPMDYVIGCVASHLNVNGVAGVNNLTTIAAVTPKEQLRRIVMDEAAYIRINDAGGDALAAGDNHPVGTFELTFNRPQEGDNVTDGNDYVTQPTQTDFGLAELSLTFPTYGDAAAQLRADFEADTVKKIEIFARGAVIEAAERYRITLQMPRAVVVGRPGITITGPGKIAATLRFRLTKSSDAPTGMSVTNPLGIQLVNTRTTNLLA